MARIIGFDLGDKRIGVAISDPGGILASPFTIIERTNEAKDIETMLRIISEQKVERIIIGLPKLMSGAIGQQAEKVQNFVTALSSCTKIPIELRDERLTTVTAIRMKEETSKKKKNRKIRYDAMAAAVILQEYLNENRFLTSPPLV
jgi:putative Holliday junction resolvase